MMRPSLSFLLTATTFTRLLRTTSPLSPPLTVSSLYSSLTQPPPPVSAPEWHLSLRHLISSHTSIPFHLVPTSSHPLPSLGLNFHSDVERLRSGVPVQYVLGAWDFHCLSDIICREPVLVPRPETEELVDWSLSSLLPDDTVLDVGTGTGCIGISLLCSSPSLKVYGVEPGDKARLLTMDNVKRFKPEFERGGRYMGVVGDTAEGVLGRLRKGEMSELRDVDVVVSNPPYIPTEVWKGLEATVKDHEDRAALDGGKDGLDVLLDVIRIGEEVGARAVYIEGDDGHPKTVARIGAQWGWKVEARKDLFGKERFMKITF